MMRFFPALKNSNLPNLLTSMAVIIGFVSLLLTVNNHILLAVSILPFAIICDRLDGIIARKLNLVSDFGKSLDSFADLFNYCFLPAFIAYRFGFDSTIERVILAAFVLSGLWRLSNFNLSEKETKNGKPCFLGLPTPYATAIFIVLIALSTLNITKWLYSNWYLWAFFIIAAIMQVSALRIEKNGLLTKLLFLLTPIAVVVMWINQIIL